MENRIIDRDKLSGFSAVLAILVVLLHAENLHAYTMPEGVFSSFVQGFEWFFSENICKIAVPAFFMISGVLFYRDFDVTLYPKKLKSRVFSLIIPYFVWNLFRYVLFYILGVTGFAKSVMGARPLEFNLESIIASVVFYKSNLGFWFIYQLILYTFLSPVIRLLVKNKWVGLISIFGMVALYSSDISGEFLMVTMNKRFILLDSFIYYLVGAYVGTHGFWLLAKKSNTIKYLSFGGLLLGQALHYIYLHTCILWIYVLWLAVSAISLWYAYDYIKPAKWLTPISSITFFVYAGHGTILEFLQLLGAYTLPDSPIVALITYIMFPVITFTLLLGLSKLYKRYTPRLWKILNGGR